jgi:hypothetical protein
MTVESLVERWRDRREELARLGALVHGASLCDELLADLASLARANRETVLTIGDAAAVSGYSTDHLGRLLRTGRLQNVGSRHRPRIRLADLPRKPNHQPPLRGLPT